jgi:hypothetical protein
MAFAQGSRSEIGYIAEVTFGTTPDTPTLVRLPFNSHTLDLSKQTVESAEIRSDRQITIMRHGNKNVSGELTADLRAEDYDPFLEAAFFGTISTGTLKCGTTAKYFTLEDRATDITQYRAYTGMMVNSMDLSVKPNAMAEIKFGFIGKNMTQSGTSVTGSALTAASTNQPFDSFTGTIDEGGSSIAIVAGLDLKIENGLGPTFVVGSSTTPQMEYGRAKVTGTIEAYYQDATLINKFINETVSSLEFALTDGTNTYTFTMGSIKYTGAPVPVSNEQSRMISLPFQALYHAADATTLKLVIS